MRTILCSLVAVMALAFSAGGTETVRAAEVSREDSAVAVPTASLEQQAQVHPTWYRTCGWANCSVYFNKSETRIASYGGALLSQLICVMLRTTPAALFCSAIAWAVGKAGDNAVSGGRCVKLSFSRWTGVVYYIGTYSSWRCS